MVDDELSKYILRNITNKKNKYNKKIENVYLKISDDFIIKKIKNYSLNEFNKFNIVDDKDLREMAIKTNKKLEEKPVINHLLDFINWYKITPNALVLLLYFKKMFYILVDYVDYYKYELRNKSEKGFEKFEQEFGILIKAEIIDKFFTCPKGIFENLLIELEKIHKIIKYNKQSNGFFQIEIIDQMEMYDFINNYKMSLATKDD